jgi:hypothetical protein
MSDIRVNAFKDYRVERDPKIASVVDAQLSAEYWGADGGPSDMWDMSMSEFKDQLPNIDLGFDKFTTRRKDGKTYKVYTAAQPLKVRKITKNYRRLEKVFDFLEKREGKLNPLKIERKVANGMEPGVIYPGKEGFVFINPDKGDNVELIPYPLSMGEYELRKYTFYITDIKDGGVFVWNDALERKYEDDYLY